jgi:hypothetical protein
MAARAISSDQYQQVLDLMSEGVHALQLEFWGPPVREYRENVVLIIGAALARVRRKYKKQARKCMDAVMVACKLTVNASHKPLNVQALPMDVLVSVVYVLSFQNPEKADLVQLLAYARDSLLSTLDPACPLQEPELSLARARMLAAVPMLFSLCLWNSCWDIAHSIHNGLQSHSHSLLGYFPPNSTATAPTPTSTSVSSSALATITNGLHSHLSSVQYHWTQAERLMVGRTVLRAEMTNSGKASVVKSLAIKYAYEARIRAELQQQQQPSVALKPSVRMAIESPRVVDASYLCLNQVTVQTLLSRVQKEENWEEVGTIFAHITCTNVHMHAITYKHTYVHMHAITY